VHLIAILGMIVFGGPTWDIQVAGEDAEGPRLIVSGVVSDSSGEPVPGVEIYLFHTDRSGLYGNDGNGKPRFNGTLVTDEQGRYRVATIQPAPYPGEGPPAHIHFMIKAPSGKQITEELWFTGDPRLTREQIAGYHDAGRTSRIRPIEKGEDGTGQVTRDFVI